MMDAARRGPLIYNKLLNLGYTDPQIPAWFPREDLPPPQQDLIRPQITSEDLERPDPTSLDLPIPSEHLLVGDQEDLEDVEVPPGGLRSGQVPPGGQEDKSR